MPALDRITLEQTPIHKQIYARALLDTGASLQEVCKELEMGTSTVVKIKRKTDLSPTYLEMVKRSLPTAFYALAGLAMSKVSGSKLDQCSAPQLMMVAGIAVDKARDLEGANRPIFNIVSVINECKSTRDKLEGHMASLATARLRLSQSNDAA